jgi:hypothetical protein
MPRLAVQAASAQPVSAEIRTDGKVIPENGDDMHPVLFYTKVARAEGFRGKV